MKTIYKLLILVAVLHLGVNVDAKSKFGEVIFTDTISGTDIVFNDAKIFSTPNKDNCRMVIDTKVSEIYIFTEENPENKTFTWQRVNQFDADFRFGNLITSEKFENENVDGWIRYYEMPTKKGGMLLSCLSVIRGNSYAIYILEQLSPDKTPITPEIVKNTEFKKVTGKRIDNDGRITTKMCVIFAILLLSSIIVKFLFKRSTKMKVIAMITLNLIFFCYAYFVQVYDFYTSLISIGISALVWVLVLFVFETWTDVVNFIQNAISEMG